VCHDVVLVVGGVVDVEDYWDVVVLRFCEGVFILFLLVDGVGLVLE